MTASRPSLALVVVVVLVGCGVRGLPPVPPAEDPANPDAAVPAYKATGGLETSAFEGEPVEEDKGGHHGHHGGHGGHGS